MSSKKIKTVVCSIIQNENNQIFLGFRNGKNYPGEWDLPGGKLEFQEEPREALIREVKEETNLDVEITEELAYINVIAGENHFIVLPYITKIKPDSANYNNNEPKKHERFEWFSIDNLPTPLLLSARYILDMYN